MESGLLLETFRQGWLLNIHKILLVSSSSAPQLHPYLVYATKSSAEEIAPVKCFFGINQNADAEAQVFNEIYHYSLPRDLLHRTND